MKHAPSLERVAAPLYAKLVTNTGNRADNFVLADVAYNDWLTPISPAAIDLIRRLVSAGSWGLSLATLNAREVQAFGEIDRLGIRLSRTRKPGYLMLGRAIVIVDQRTNAEAA